MNIVRRRQCRDLLKKCLRVITTALVNDILEFIDENNEKKRIWVREWIKRRTVFGASENLLTELALEDPEEYRLCLRMTPEDFEQLLSLVSPTIQKQDTILRDAIPARIKLQITLNFLATGNSYRTLQHFFRVSIPAISKFLPEVCDTIYQALEQYIKMPKTDEEWKSIAKGFEDKWNFPKCCGAIDGKHVLIMAPPNCGSKYYNYKGTSSIVLMALVDHNYCFSYVSIGSKGSESDGGILQNCELGQLLQKDLIPLGYCVVADDAFPLRHYIMKPYKCYRTALTVPQKIFNYRLSRARRIVENAFGILVSRFRVFDKKIYCNLRTVNKLVLAACGLHNFLRKTSSSTYLPPGSIDEEDTSSGVIRQGRWRAEIIELRNLESHRERRASDLANKMRDNLKNYFLNEGAVPWQYRHIYYIESRPVVSV